MTARAWMACAALAWVALTAVAPVAAAEKAPRVPRVGRALFPRHAAVPRLHPGAIEVGLAGSLTSVQGVRRGAAALRAGTFRLLGPGLGGYEGEAAYSHVGGLDLLDVELGLSWQPTATQGGAQPFVVLAGGVRQEWLGSFRQARRPVGFNAGVRMLASERAAVRLEYRYRRVLRDPVADFTEQELRAGVSLLFRNGR